MKLKDFFALIITVAVATVFVLLLKPYLFNQPVLPLTMSNNEIEDWMGAIFWPTTFVLYALGILVLFIWILKAARSQFMTATEVLSNQLFWWILLAVYWILGIVIFMSVSFFSGWMDGSKSLEPLFWFPPFVLLDGIFLFWLPTAIATPRSMRYVGPVHALHAECQSRSQIRTSS